MVTPSSWTPVSSLLLRHGSGAFSAPSLTGFALESELQGLLYDHPHLLPGVGEPAVACREFQSGVGPADVLVLHGDGELVITECKLASNPQIRREIVGQVIDYASRIWRMPMATFEAQWTQRTGISPFAEFGEQAAAVRERLATNLDDGRFTIVLAVDGINDDLRRMVEYLNSATRPEVQVLAFEVAHVRDGDVEILLPRVYGAELANAKARSSSTAQPSWTTEQYLGWLSENDPELRDPMERLIQAATSAGWQVYNGTATSPSVILGCSVGGSPLWPVSLFTRPQTTVEIRIWQVAASAANPAVLAERLAQIPGTSIDLTAFALAGYRKKVTLSSSLFVTPDDRARLMHALASLTQPQ